MVDVGAAAIRVRVVATTTQHVGPTQIVRPGDRWQIGIGRVCSVKNAGEKDLAIEHPVILVHHRVELGVDLGQGEWWFGLLLLSR